MPSAIVNDLSLAAQYESHVDFWIALRPVLAARAAERTVAEAFSCSRQLSGRSVTQELTLLQVIHLGEQAERYIALRWITKGPFCEPDDLDALQDEIYAFGDDDVTELGLGEAARRQLAGERCTAFSFRGSGFDVPSLAVRIITNDAEHECSIPNAVDPDSLKQALCERQSTKWQEDAERWAAAYSRLLIPLNAIERQLCPYPYSLTISRRIDKLLSILNEISQARVTFGDGSAELNYLISVYFQGHRALFSDESDPNKVEFKNEMTFPDPAGGAGTLFCTWHGKVRTDLPYRIHFEWPVPAGQDRIKVPYIGPKITRR